MELRLSGMLKKTQTEEEVKLETEAMVVVVVVEEEKEEEEVILL